MDDLISIKGSAPTLQESDSWLAANKVVKPRPVQATSIPGMLALFQNEWDALMLETFTLKQHLDTVSLLSVESRLSCRCVRRAVPNFSVSLPQ